MGEVAGRLSRRRGRRPARYLPPPTDAVSPAPMHELSIAVSLVEAVSQEADRVGAGRVGRVYLKVGALSGVVADALAFSFDVAAAGTRLEGAVLEIEAVPVRVFCTPCGTEKPLPDLFAFCCPDCGAPTPEIRQGRELELTAFEIEEAAGCRPAAPLTNP